MTEFVSVVIPTYCREHLILRALKSALMQTVPGDEVIVVDDGSADGTKRVLERYLSQIRYIWIENSGAGAARNLGVKEARNPLVAFLDSDDEWMPFKLELQRNYMQSDPDIVMSFSDFAITRSSDGSEVRRYLMHWHKDPRKWDEILPNWRRYSKSAALPFGVDDFNVHVGSLYRDMARALYVPTTTVMVRTAAAGPALHFEEGVPTFEDWFCFGRICGVGKVAYLDIETSWQHGHSGSRLTDADALVRAETRLKLLRQVWAANEEFIEKEGAYLRELVDKERLTRALHLIFAGRMAETRDELSEMYHAPLMLRLATILPGSLARILLRALVLIRRRIRGAALSGRQ